MGIELGRFREILLIKKMLQQIKKKDQEQTVLGDDHFILGRRGRGGGAAGHLGGGIRLFFCMTSTGLKLNESQNSYFLQQIH